MKPSLPTPMGMPSALRRRLLAGSASLTALAASGLARAQLSIEITGAGANRLPITIAQFAGDPTQTQSITQVIQADLERSGLFRLVKGPNQPVSESVQPNYAEWRSAGADAFVGGSLTATADGRYEIRFRLFDVARQVTVGGLAFVTSPQQLRIAAHRIADYIYEKLIGEPGVFSTRIAYVVKQGTRFEMQIADADGHNPQAALISREPIISPAWSPDGTQLAYVSFENKKPIVFVHSLSTGKRHVVANFKGSNSAPAWSPDGRTLAVVLTKDGGSQVFLINVDGSGARRITSSSSIDTEPRFSPDGAWIYFTSDRGGTPQIYRLPTTGGAVERVTFEGAYNVTPRPSPDGKSIAYIALSNGRFQLALLDLASRQRQILTDSDKDESPTFAPNGRMILIATEIGGKGVLSAVSVDGRVKQRLSIAAGDVREPAWSPFIS